MREFRPPTPEELSAYADGELEPDRQAEIALYLSQHDEHDALISADAAILGGLRNLREQLAPEKTPERLRKAAAPVKKFAIIFRERAGLIVGAVGALALIGFALALFTGPDYARHDRERDDQAIADAAGYYLDNADSAVEFGVASETEIRRALPLLGEREIGARKMANTGFVYLGGRTRTIGGGGAVVLFYRDSAGANYGLTIWKADTPVLETRATPLNETLFWSENGHRYAVTGGANATQLEAFRAAYQVQTAQPQ